MFRDLASLLLKSGNPGVATNSSIVKLEIFQNQKIRLDPKMELNRDHFPEVTFRNFCHG